MSLRVLPRAANNIRFFADFARDRLDEPARTLHGGERNRVRYDPAGVTAVSTPWNAPFMLATWRVGPALAAGNTVVLKPPEWAPLTCSLLGELADQAGLPPGVLNIVHGTGADAGAPLTGHQDVERVAFTGSPATARTVYARRRRDTSPPSRSNSAGKSPFIVFEDADLDAAAATAAYQYDNSGQVCLAGTRLLVQRSIAHAFQRASTNVKNIKVGDPRDPDTTYGPLIHPIALERVTGTCSARSTPAHGSCSGAQPLEWPLLPADPVHRRPARRRDPPAARCSAPSSPSRRSRPRPRRSRSRTAPSTASRRRSTRDPRTARRA